MAFTLPEQVGGEVEDAGEREAGELVQPQAPTRQRIPLPGLLLLLAGGAVEQEGGRSGAEERGGAFEEHGREREEAADDGEGVAWVEERLGKRGGHVVARGRGGGRGREGEQARVGAERGAAG